MSLCNTILVSKKQNLMVKNNLTDLNVKYSVYSVGTLRLHYSRYLQIFLAHNTITSTKCNEKNNITSHSTRTNPSYVPENATKPSHGWTQPMSISD